LETAIKTALGPGAVAISPTPTALNIWVGSCDSRITF
jgi:hypothetical protein